ncbi:hypothetical protein ACHAWU_000255 [Discostella pseudostelligera]|uniref:Uncharacterized protein n=1 Tax=Discostella pseudostelligera TaxID=259834 RepID=A0ABD3MKX0_9STRA
MIYFTFFVALVSLVAAVAQANGQQDLAAAMDANQGGIFAADDEELPSVVLLQQQKEGNNKSTKSDKKIPGFVISGVDESFKIVSCEPTSVEVTGSRAAKIKQGNIIIYTPHDTATCSSCNPLFRKVQSISTSPITGNLILATTLLTVAEIMQVGTSPDGIAVGSVLMELLFNCPHTTDIQGASIDAFSSAQDSNIGAFLSSEEDVVLSSMLLGSCNANWLLKNADGRCTHTNCYVGVTGNANDCFECKTACDNGCGHAGLPTIDGNFGAYDFGPACCNHDFCWASSTYTKEECDTTFFDQMKNQCPSPSPNDVVIRLYFPISAPFLSSIGCDALATTFYALVMTTVGTDAYNTAKSDQMNYEQQDSLCIAQCPSTQQSGGQGTTVLKIDMGKTSGTFHLRYNMYEEPDWLTIDYEDEFIFNTGGTVSGEFSTDVDFGPGSSTIITVTILAADEGTAWDVEVACPYPILC